MTLRGGLNQPFRRQSGFPVGHDLTPSEARAVVDKTLAAVREARPISHRVLSPGLRMIAWRAYWICRTEVPLGRDFRPDIYLDAKLLIAPLRCRSGLAAGEEAAFATITPRLGCPLEVAV